MRNPQMHLKQCGTQMDDVACNTHSHLLMEVQASVIQTPMQIGKARVALRSAGAEIVIHIANVLDAKITGLLVCY